MPAETWLAVTRRRYVVRHYELSRPSYQLLHALLQARGTTLFPIFLPTLPGEPSGSVTASPPAAEDPNLEAFIRLCLTSAEGDLYAEAHRQVDRLLLPRVLEDTGGNQLQAARRLGIAPETLRRRLLELGLHFTRRMEARKTIRSRTASPPRRAGSRRPSRHRPVDSQASALKAATSTTVQSLDFRHGNHLPS